MEGDLVDNILKHILFLSMWYLIISIIFGEFNVFGWSYECRVLYCVIYLLKIFKNGR